MGCLFYNGVMSKQVNIRLDSDTLEKIDMIAEHNHVTRTYVILDLIKYAFENRGVTIPERKLDYGVIKKNSPPFIGGLCGHSVLFFR